MQTNGECIHVDEARTNNLKGVSCRFPHGRMTVVTGVSGSGKSSLAFDTVYAEGQRRYVETLSTYARQFLQQMRKPPVKAVRNVPPALALRQGNSVSGARSTVGSVTEVTEHLQLLFAGAGSTVCKQCGAPVTTWTPGTVVDWLVNNGDGERVIVLGTVRPLEDQGIAPLLRDLVADGYRRVLDEGRLVDLDAPEAADLLERDELRVVIDRLRIEADSQRLADSIETAFAFGERIADIVRWDDSERTEWRFYDHHRCDVCATMHHEPIPALFEVQSTIGACGRCGGYGRTVGIDHHKVVPDPRLSIADGAVACFQTASMRKHRRRLVSAFERLGFPVDVPWVDLPTAAQEVVFRGDADFLGVRGFFRSLEDDRYKPHIRILIARYRGYADCEECDGSGLSADARAVRIEGAHLGHVQRKTVTDMARWVRELELPGELAVALDPLITELHSRLTFLEDAGVGYLAVNRQARTLSGGEMHRVLLATSIGRMLTDTCYVLDEPTAGLHARDTARLMGVVRRLRDIGNTVIVVEHDPDVIREADHIVELGPAGGDAGGTLLYEGAFEGLRETDTPTGTMIRSGTQLVEVASRPDGFLALEGACVNNLRNVSVSFPRGQLSVVTGVSGSGKSSLVVDALHAKLMEARGQREQAALAPTVLHGDSFDEVVLVDQSSIPRSVRSCALTFSGAYGPVRDLFSATPHARANGLKAGAFSFNTAGGRCERCDGTGVMTVEMHFIADVRLPCDVCDGKRFQPHVLATRYEGRTIADVFAMTVSSAIEFFSGSRSVVRRLEPLEKVGLGYVKLGQPTSELSGGELQRLKLASYVGKAGGGAARLFIFDEPTVGLHMQDVRQLVVALRELTAAGHTIIVVEHNLDLVAASDWVVDLGPGPGAEGGRLVYEGRVAGLMEVAASFTGQDLRASLDTR